MTDEAYMFVQDCKEKKSIARSAKNVRKGSKSKKCSLPSDYMTKKEWKERCGKIMSYNMNEPMTWQNFKNCPIHIQKEYIEGLRSKYNVNASALAKMFGVSTSTVIKHVDRKGLDIKFERSKYMSEDEMRAWHGFYAHECNNADNTTFISEEAPAFIHEVSKTDIAQHSTDDPVRDSARIRKVTLQFDGILDIGSIANSLRAILGNDTNGILDIICEIK